MDSLALSSSYKDIMGKRSKVVIASRGVHSLGKRSWLRRRSTNNARLHYIEYSSTKEHDPCFYQTIKNDVEFVVGREWWKGPSLCCL